MAKMKSIGLVIMIVAVMLATSLVIPLLGTTGDVEQKSVARIQAGIAFVIEGPTLINGVQWHKVLSAGEEFYFNITLAASSIYSLSDLNITWNLETDWNTSVDVSGPSLHWIYYNEGSRTVNVTVTDKTNSANTTTEPISVQIIADMDTDGLPDIWERKYFGTTARTDAPSTTDFDNDGWTDLEEYQNGTDPTVFNAKPGFIETYAWLIALIAIIIVVIVLLMFIIMPKMKTKREEDEKKKIAAAVEVEKSLLGLDELEEKPKK